MSDRLASSRWFRRDLEPGSRSFRRDAGERTEFKNRGLIDQESTPGFVPMRLESIAAMNSRASSP